MKSIVSASLCLFALSAAQTAMADLRIVGNAGIASFTLEQDSTSTTDMKFDGYSGSLGVQYDVFKLAGVSAFVGGGLGVQAVSYETTVPVLGTLKLTQAETYLPVEAGVQLSAIPLLRLQALAQYQHTLKGTVTAFSVSKDIDSGHRVMVGGRALLSIFPFVSFGVYGNSLVSGETKVSGSSADKWDKGYEAGASLTISL